MAVIGGRADAAEVAGPVEIRRQRLELCRRELVVDLLGIAPRHAVERRLRERRLETHHGLGVLARRVRRFTRERQHFRHVLDVLLPDLDRRGSSRK